ncbi:MAG: ABC transporter substrate-binding protein [Acidimicrobiales bacterium]
MGVVGDQPVDRSEEGLAGHQSRRDFLRRTAAGAAVLGVGGLLEACGSSPKSSATTSSGAPSGSPKRGGTITLASTGGGSADTLDANDSVSNLDFARAPQLYDTLMEPGADNVPQLHLAEEVTPNSDATLWTIRVKKGIEFHDGKSLTADDVLYTFNRIVSNKFSAASGLAYADLKNAKKLDTYTLQIPMTSGYSIFPISLIGNGEMSIVPVGYNPKKPVGTGPFTVKSFTPGQQSVFAANKNYFVSGEPYADSVVIVDYSDETSQVNALTSGQANCCDQLSIASVDTVKSGGNVANIWEGPGWVPFTMRLDVAPFNDVNVRQALRLCMNRPEAREVVYGGYGFLGNDIFGRADPEYDTAIPQRVQDIAQAKSLLKKANQEHLTVTLVTSPIKTGAVQLAQVLKQQASAAGITINLNSITSTEFFGANYTKWTFAQDWWSGYPYLRQVGYSMVAGAPWDETHWDDGSYISKYASYYKQALGIVDETKQADIVHEMQMMDWNEGGYIIPAFNPVIVGQSSSLKGAVTQKTGDPWIEYRFRTLWVD